jgi:ketosteroid isomerase-like protein
MSEANITTTKSLYDAFARGDIGAIVNACTPDADWHVGGRKDDFPVFGPRKGRAQIEAFFAEVAAVLDFSEFTPKEYYCDRDKVFVTGYYAAIVKKTGRRAASDWIHIFTFRDGKVAKFREFLDTASFAAAYRD